MIRILVIDDEQNVLKQIVNFLNKSEAPEGETFEVDGETNHEDALARLQQIDPAENYYHVIVTDMRMGAQDEEGLEILRQLTEKSPITIVLTAFASIPNCVKSMRAGAWDYIEKNPEDESDPYENLLESIKKAYNERLKKPYPKMTQPDAKWINENMVKLMEEYSGEVVAVLDRVVVDHDSDYQSLMERIGEKFKIARPMIVSIPDISKERVE